MGTYRKTAALAVRIKRECKNHDVQEIGVALSSLLVEFAQHVGMPKAEFMDMMDGLWHLQCEAELDEDNDNKMEVH